MVICIRVVIACSLYSIQCAEPCRRHPAHILRRAGLAQLMQTSSVELGAHLGPTVYLGTRLQTSKIKRIYLHLKMWMLPSAVQAATCKQPPSTKKHAAAVAAGSTGMLRLRIVCDFGCTREHKLHLVAESCQMQQMKQASVEATYCVHCAPP
jgi:hypothetical protein